MHVMKKAVVDRATPPWAKASIPLLIANAIAANSPAIAHPLAQIPRHGKTAKLCFSEGVLTSEDMRLLEFFQIFLGEFFQLAHHHVAFQR